jgi:hypothetical protein
VLQLAKYPLFQSMSFVECPFSNLGHRERLAQRIEHAVDVFLTPCAARRQDDRQRLRDSMRCDVAPLTFEQYRAGAPCPGCGLPYVDSVPFDFKGTINLSDAERAVVGN